MKAKLVLELKFGKRATDAENGLLRPFRAEPDCFPAAGRKLCGSCGFLGCLRGRSRNAVVAPQEDTKRATITEKPQNRNEESHRKSFTHNGLVSRDNKTAIELFLTGLGGWDAIMRRRMDDGKSKQD